MTVFRNLPVNKDIKSKRKVFIIFCDFDPLQNLPFTTSEMIGDY